MAGVLPSPASDCCNPCALGIDVELNLIDLITQAVGASANVINITQAPYGAVGDGVTDDSAAIQTALDAAVGMTLLIPDGTFVASALTVPSNIRLTGTGTLRLPDDTDDFWILHIEDADNVLLDTITLDGNISGQSVWSEHRHCVKISDSSNVTIDRCRFINPTGDCIFASHGDLAVAPYVGFTGLKVTNNRFLGTSLNRNGLSLVTGDGAIITGNTFDRMARGTMPGAIDIETHIAGSEFIRNVTIADNDFIGHVAPVLQQGIAVNNNVSDGEVTGLLIESNRFDGHFRYGIALFGNDSGTGIDQAQLHDNDFRHSTFVVGGVGILTRDFIVSIHDNDFDTVGDAAIQVLSGRFSVRSNYIRRASEYAIRLHGTARGTARSNIILDAGFSSANAARGALYFDCSDCVLSDNDIFCTGSATQQGLYSPSGTGNYLSGNYLTGIASKNYNIAGAQRWGHSYSATAGPSVDIVQERTIALFNKATPADIVNLLMGGDFGTVHDVLIRRNAGELQFVRPDGLGGEVYADGRVGTLNATQLHTTGNLFAQGAQLALRTIAVAGNATAADTTILVDTTSGPLTFTLQDPTALPGKIVIVKKISADANVLTLATDGGLIDGTATKTTTTQYFTWRAQSTGTGWVLV